MEQQIINQALAAEKHKDYKSAFFNFEKLMFYYPEDINAIKIYAEFCERHNYNEKGFLLYSKLYEVTSKYEYLEKKYLMQVRISTKLDVTYSKIMSDKKLSKYSKTRLAKEIIKILAGSKKWNETDKVCMSVEVKDLDLKTLQECMNAASYVKNDRRKSAYYQRLVDFEPYNIEAVKIILDLEPASKSPATHEKYLKKFQSLSPNDFGIGYRLAGFYESQGRFKEAKKIYEELIKKGDNSEHLKTSYAAVLRILNEQRLRKSSKPQPENNKPYVPTKEDLMYKAMEDKDYKKAQSLADEILLKSPDNLKVLKARSDIALEQQDCKSAIICLEKLKSLNPSGLNEHDKMTLAYCYSKTENFNSALLIIEELLQEGKSQKALLPKAIEYSMAQKDYKKARSYLNQLLQSEPDNEEILKLSGDLYSMESRYDLAINTYLKLVKLYPKSEYYFNLSGFYMAVNDFPKAKIAIEKAYNSPERNQKITREYLHILMTLKDTQSAYKVAVENNLLQTKEGYEIQGDIAFREKQYSQAENYYKNALSFSKEDKFLKNKLADSYRAQKRHKEAKEIYQSFLEEDLTDKEGLMGMGYAGVEQREFNEARGYFQKILDESPEDIDAHTGIINSYSAYNDFLNALKAARQLPQNDETDFLKAQIYYDMRLFNKSKSYIKDINTPDAEKLKQAIKRERAYIITPSYSFLIQTLSEEFKLNANKWGVHASAPIGKNLNFFTDYTLYLYSSGVFPPYNRRYTNFTNEIRIGAEGRVSEHLELKADIGAKIFQNAGAMLNTNSWLKYYVNDKFNLKLGFYRDNLEQSYLSAVGFDIDGAFTGQVADNRLYLEYEYRLPKEYYAFGRLGCGIMDAQNLPNNPYLEGMAGFGKLLYHDFSNPKHKKKLSSNLVSYNAGWRDNLLNLYDKRGNLYGGYWSPAFFTANTADLRYEGIYKNKLTYGGGGFAGWQYAQRPSQSMFVWGAEVYVGYRLNDHVDFNTNYRYFNYADVQRNQFGVNMTIRGF
ncbi:MAG: tetratricopeptide repeat protein [Candidatus Gastranaerophilales bacterium]|nr:tetratricopeptide repeat protein [Candidatus Gastranaerophilales bacterium]